jgi:hypothetical protein
MRAILALGLAAAALWSGLLWWLWQVARDPGPAVVQASRVLSIDPKDTQWLAQLLDESVAGLLFTLALVWLLGLVAIAAGCWLAASGGKES